MESRRGNNGTSIKPASSKGTKKAQMALGRRPLMSLWRGSAGAPGSPWNVSIIRFPPLKRAPLLTPPKPPLPPPLPPAPALDWPKNPSPEKAAACRG